MKLLSYLFTLFFAFNALAVAPYGIKGQQQAPTLYSNVHQFPNNQVTNLGGINALVESGNSNILSNPSFEHSTFSTDWSFSGTSSFFEDVTRVLNGKKSSAILAVSQSFALVQDSTLYASQFAGQVQGIATVRIKANAGATNIKVCSRQAGVTSTTNCVDVVANDTWGLYKVPFILGATSNGISIASTGNTTSVVYIDDAFVGPVDLKVDAPSINVQSSILDQTATFGAVAITGALTVSSGSGVYSYNSGTGVYTLLKNATVTVTNAQSAGTATAIIPAIYVNGGLRSLCHSPSAINQWCEASYTSKHLAGEYFSISNAQATTNAQKITVSATEYVATSVYTSPVTINADKIGEIIHTTNSTAPQGFISALNKSIGQTGSGATYTGQTYFALYEHLWSIAGLTTTAGDVYRISSAKGASASADFSANKTITIDYETNAPFIRGKASAAGVGAYTDSENKDHFHIGGDRRATAFPYSSGAPYGRTSTSNGVVSTQGGTEVSSLAHTSSIGGTEAKPKNVSLNIFIRFAGDTQLITGQFNGLQSCVDTKSCTDTFSATIASSGTVVSGSENVDWINGNCTTTVAGINTDYTCDYVTGLVSQAMNCVSVDTNSATNPNATRVYISTSSQFKASNLTGRGITIICQKQGADYIGKTAMAVASDQNVRSIGSTNVDIQSVYFGSGATCATACTTGNCTICNQVGSKITSVSFASTGSYRLNGIDGLKYNCTGNGLIPGVSAGTILDDRVASTTSYKLINTYNISALSGNAGYVSVTCIGIP